VQQAANGERFNTIARPTHTIDDCSDSIQSLTRSIIAVLSMMTSMIHSMMQQSSSDYYSLLQ